MSSYQRSASEGLLEEALLSGGFVLVAVALLGGLMLAERFTFAGAFAEDDRRRERERLLSGSWAELDAAAAAQLNMASDSDEDDDDYGVDEGMMLPADEEMTIIGETRKRRPMMTKKKKLRSDVSPKSGEKMNITNMFKRRKLKTEDEPPLADEDDQGGVLSDSELGRKQNRKGTRRRAASWLTKMKWSDGTNAIELEGAPVGARLPGGEEEESHYCEEDSSFPMQLLAETGATMATLPSDAQGLGRRIDRADGYRHAVLKGGSAQEMA